MTPYCPEPLVANAREGCQYKGRKEPDAEAKVPLLDSRPAAEIEDEEPESEDDDSVDGESEIDEEEEEEEQDGDDEPHKADVVPEWKLLNAGVKQFARGLEDSQISEQSDGYEEEELEDESEEEELEDESEEESLSLASEDYEYDIALLTAHYQRKSQREHDRFVAQMEAHISKVQKGADEAVAGFSKSKLDRPIASPPDDTGIDGQWLLYNEGFLPDEDTDHRLDLRKSTPEEPVYDSNWNHAQGIAFDIFIQSACPDVEFSCEGILPLKTNFPESATLEPFRLIGKNAIEAGTAWIGDRKVENEHIFMDIVFLGDGCLKLYLPVDFLKNAEMRKQSSSDNSTGEDSMVEFIGRKDLSFHLGPRPKTPPSPKESSSWL